MRYKVYIETSIISYLAARPSRMVVGAAHQQITQAWWEKRSMYDLFVSQAVVQECKSGDPEAILRRMSFLNGLEILSTTKDMVRIAEQIISHGILPEKAIDDALHISIATLHQIDILLTWNCRHIANPIIQKEVSAFLEKKDLDLPLICTPEQLLGGSDDEI